MKKLAIAAALVGGLMMLAPAAQAKCCYTACYNPCYTACYTPCYTYRPCWGWWRCCW